MKTISLNFQVIFILGLLMLGSCSKNYDDLVPVLESVPAGGVESVNVMKVLDETLEIEVTIFAVDHFGNFIKGLKVEDFSIENNSGYESSILSLDQQAGQKIGPYSASLLFDQSGSINTTDPGDDRILAGSKFIELLARGDEASIAAFSSGGHYTSPYQLLEGFSQDEVQLIQTIKDLAGQTGGGTPLYESIFNLTPYTGTNGSNENKALIAFTDGQDTQGGVSVDQMVERACEEGVRIYTVGLSSSIDAGVLSEVAFRTGGAVMLAQDAVQLVSVYSSLGDLLHGEAEFYKLRLSIQNTSRNWGPNQRVQGIINLELSEQYPVKLPFQIDLTSQNAGNLDQREPTCDCTQSAGPELAQKWKNEADKYLNAISDPLPFNEAITCAYIDIYQKNPDKFKWAGLGAIVSGEVGEYNSFSTDWFPYLDPIEVTTKDWTDFTTSAIVGNRAVFDDLIWQHLAFYEGGIEEIEKIYCSGAMDLTVYRAWLKIAQDDENLVWEGNRDLLYYEQKNILQDELYSNHIKTWASIQAFDRTLGLIFPVFIESPVPNHGEVFPYVPFTYTISDFDDRWKWIETKILPAWRTYQSNTNNESELNDVYQAYCDE